MLYLAEVQKKSGNMFGGGKAELKLLACQRSEQNWTAVPNEESVSADEANDYGAGALVLVEMTGNKQVRSVQPAARQLVSILQNFSRLQERFKTQEEEIDQWKQSLTYQSQELNRREMEMEAQRENLAQMEDDFARLETQRQEVSGLQQQINQQREEFERKQQELQGAWDHLRGEQQRLEERQGELQNSAALDVEQAQALQGLLARLAESVPGGQSWQEDVTSCLGAVQGQQDILSHHWQVLEQQRSNSQQLQEEVERQAQEIQHRWQEWHQAQAGTQTAEIDVKVKEEGVKLRQQQLQALEAQAAQIETLYQQVFAMASGSGSFRASQQVDMVALEGMGMEDLQRRVHDLEQEMHKLSQFVQIQEEELTAKQQEISELEQKIQAANDFDRLNLENELADERDGYQMLNETLVGQRRILAERQVILGQHQAVLRRRQGYSDPGAQEAPMDLTPVVKQLESQKQQTESGMKSLKAEIEQLQAALQPAYDQVEAQKGAIQAQRTDIQQAEQALQERRMVAMDSAVKINLYQDLLQPIQDHLDGLRQQLEGLSRQGEALNGTGDRQNQAIAEMRHILDTLSAAPAMAMS